MNIHKEPAFIFWVPRTLYSSNRILKKLKTAYHKNNLNFGLVVSCSIQNAERIDAINNNTFWRDAINNEMSNIKIAFKFLDSGNPLPVGFKQI